jgi:large subunit ribosomal protein L6
MSRIGTKPVRVPEGVTVQVGQREITAEGPKGTLSQPLRPEVTVHWSSDEGEIRVDRKKNTRAAKAFHGLTRALINNMIIGVTEGFSRDLEINGVGWTARVEGQSLALNVGYADIRQVSIPEEVDVEVQGNRITIRGMDKQAVGQFAAEVRGQRPPEPYQGKGIKYADETIVRKEGKAFAGG